MVLPPVDIPDEITYHIAGRSRVQVDPEDPALALRQVVSAVERSETQPQVRRRRRLFGCVATLAVLAVVAGGVTTVVTGRLPPWADTPTCSSIRAEGRSRPATFVLSGVAIAVTIRNAGDRAVALPDYGALTILIPGVHESPMPFLSCDLTVPDIQVDFPR